MEEFNNESLKQTVGSFVNLLQVKVATYAILEEGGLEIKFADGHLYKDL